MAIPSREMQAWIGDLLGANPDETHKPLGVFLAAIPRLESLADLPAGTSVLVRGDVDCKPGPNVGDGDVRLRSMQETLQFGRDRGWKQIVFGHVGRKPEGTLAIVRQRLAEILGSPVAFFADWLDEATLTVSDKLAAGIEKSPPGSIILLENTRKYEIERLLWNVQPDDAGKLAGPLAQFANQMADKIAHIYIHEALSAGSLDSSSVVAPAAMDRVALGKYAAAEFEGPMMRCREATLVVFSGLKTDKLDDLQAIIDRGKVRWVFAAGSLAMALRKADAQLDGRDFCLGVAENPRFETEPWYIPGDRVEQASQMLLAGRAKEIEFVLPVDSVLQDGRVAEELRPHDQQFDIGPETSAMFERKVGEYIAAVTSEPRLHAVAFHNGVFGKFEEARFAEGTKRFVPQLKRMKDAGVEVYVGGGEGGAALEKYGDENWVTHNFTAGGTVLNVLGSQPVPYLLALDMAVRSKVQI